MSKEQLKSLAPTKGKYGIDVTKKLIAEHFQFQGDDPTALFRKASALIEARKSTNNKTKQKKATDELIGMAVPLSSALSLETHFFPLCCIEQDMRSFALEMINNLKKEYDVRTPSEKALVQTAVVSFCQFQECGRLFWRFSTPDFLSHEKGHFLSIYSKEADKANRRFITAIQTLKQIKTQPIKVNVKANNAYMAQNQQINNPIDVENNKKY